MGIKGKIQQFVKSVVFNSLKAKDEDGYYPLNMPIGGYDFNGKNYTDAYGSNPYVFNVVNRITERAVSLDRELVNKNTSDFIANASLNQLLENPNQDENIDEFLYRYYANYLVVGEAFVVQKNMIGIDTLSAVFCPSSVEVIINVDSRSNVLSYDITHKGQTANYQPNEVLHVKRPSIIDGTQNHGFSTLTANRRVWQTNNEVWESEATIHKNKGVSGILYVDGKPMTPTESKEFQKEYDRDTQGSNAYKVRTSTVKVGYVPMGLSPTDLKSTESIVQHLRVITAGYNVASQLFGDTASSTYNNVAEMKRAFIIDAVLPLVKKLDKALIDWISEKLGLINIEWTVDLNKIPELRGVNIELSNMILKQIEDGLISPEFGFSILYPNSNYSEVNKNNGGG